MEIKLRINNQEKTFVNDFVSARALRQNIELRKTIKFEDLSVSDLDKLMQSVCDIFNKQFTIDDIYDGLASNKLMPEIARIFKELSETMGES